ncbi:MAG: PAS domain S-box protein [Roseiflexaceae bacterium]|nr:PAS domain S-box protein [Roseiflexaceae bacterium]
MQHITPDLETTTHQGVVLQQSDMLWVFRRLTQAGILFQLLQLAVFYISQDYSLPIFVSSLVCLAAVMIGHALIKRGRTQLAICLLIGTLLAAIIAGHVLTESSQSALLISMTLVLVLALTSLERRLIEIVLWLGVISSSSLTLLALYRMQQGRMTSETPVTLLISWFAFLIVVWLLWQFYLRLTTALALAVASRDEQQTFRLALAQSEARFAYVFRSRLIGVAIATVDQLLIIDANEQILQMTGYRAEEVIGRSLFEFSATTSSADHARFLDKLHARQALLNQEIVYRHSSGEEREMLASFETVHTGDTGYVIVLAQDVTTRKRTERALRESERFYRLITENTRDLIALLDEQGAFVYASPSYQGVLNYATAQLIGQPVFALVFPDDSANFCAYWQELHTQGEQLISVRLLAASGEVRWFEVQATTLEQPELRGVVLVARDTTERRNLEAQFQQSQKMEIIGRLAGGVAHDFNNLISAINGYTELALGDLPADSAVRQDITEIQRAAGRAAGLSRQLLTLARRQVIETKLVDLNALLLETDRLLRRLLGQDVELVTLLAAEDCVVRADPGQIEQVLINLAINARDAMRDGGKLVIETDLVQLDDAYVRAHVGARAGSYARITVTDTGDGMSPETQRAVFEPFFTTKPPGQGTGLGLATSYGIITQHGGSITVYSELGHGTSFKIYLPHLPMAIGEPALLGEPSEFPSGTEVILLAEDEPSVREIVSRVLRARGYTVLETTNGDEALRLVEQHVDQPIDLLLTDLVMPVMGGVALAERLRELRPSLRVLMMSGYSGNTNQPRKLGAAQAFIQKPFSIVALAQKVRAVLDA